MIIKCPNCNRRFDLQRRPPVTFCCPRCSFTAPFSVVISCQEMSSSTESTKADLPKSENLGSTMGSVAKNNSEMNTKTNVVIPPQHNATRVVEGLANPAKTRLVPNLQIQPKGVIQITYRGKNYGAKELPRGNPYTIGRNSSDGTAQVKITPDISMSRIHAKMRTGSSNGQPVYQISSARSENPVYVNGAPIQVGKGYILKSGDKILMGETTMVFRLI